jgi:subtilase family serine protease
MNFKGLRALPGILVLCCLIGSMVIAGSFISIPLPGMGAKAYAASAPDLFIESITWSPAQPVLDDLTYFTVTIANLGDDVALNSRLHFIIDNEIIQSEIIDTITGHGTVRYIYRWRAEYGTHVTKAIIDANNTVLESNETNNEIAYTFSVLAPDLVIDSIISPSGDISTGDVGVFTVNLKNIGNAPAEQCTVSFYVDGEARGYKASDVLAPGAVFSSEFRWAAATGQHIISATADAMNDVTEGDESNNTLTKVFSTTPPDLVVSAISWSPVNRTETGNVTMSVTVKNQGAGDALSSWLFYYIDNKLETTVFIDPLDAGKSVTKTFIWSPGMDERTFSATIDGNEIIAESNDYNNSYSVVLPALGLPDLVIQSMSWSPQSPKVNSKVVFTVVVKNTGLRTVEKCYLSFHVSDKYMFKNSITNLGPGKTQTLTYECFLAIPTVSIYGIIDSGNDVKESNEANNEMSNSFTPVQPVPVEDLSIENITFSPSDPSPGDEVTITAVLRNNGRNSANASSAVCYIDNELIGSIYFGQIPANSSMERTIKWKAVIGTHQIKIIIDPNNAIYEISETNNEKTVSITATTADLAVESIEWFPAIPEVGADIQFSITFKNQGQKESASCYASYYVGDSNHGQHYIDALAPGASVTKSFPWNMQSTTLTFSVVIDEVNAILEMDETNNTRTAVIPAPNLTLRGVTCSEDYPEANAVLTFTADVFNNGRGQAAVSLIAAYVDGTALEKTTVPALSPGQSSQTVFYWTAVPGKHTLRVVADEGNGIAESNEGDNVKEIIIFVPLASSVVNDTPVGDPQPTTTPIATETPEVTATPTPTDVAIEDLFKEIDEETAPDISGNLSAASDETSGGIKDILMNKFLIFGLAGAGVAAIAVLFILKKRGSQPKKEKTPKQPKAPKAQKPKKDDKKKVQKPVQAGDTLSGKPAVLVPPPPKPTAKPGLAPIKAVVSPAPVTPAANMNLGSTLIKQQSQTPPPAVPPVPPVK